MVGRKDEMKFLAEQYNRDSNSFVVLYGRTGIGKTTVLNEFMKDKRFFYYCVKDCSESEQKFILADEWSAGYNIKPQSDEITDILRETVNEDITDGKSGKTLIVIDEVYLALRQGSSMLEALSGFWEENAGKNNIMIVITASSVQWAENSMVSDLGELAMQITGIQKLSPFGFLEIVNRFPSISSKDAVYVYGILGGVPGYMDMWDSGKSLRANIIDLFLDKNALMYREPERFLKSELRELSFYNTVLYNLACGRQKLNELHARTGYSRAKISVYIKNLIELDIVEKVFSFDEGKKDNVKKGIYAIKEPVIHFWYRFVFPNLSELEKGNKEYVYDKIIKPQLDNYIHMYFVRVSKEYLVLMSKYSQLPLNIEMCESWYGKECTIDLAAKDESSGKILAGKCKWGNKKFEQEDFEELIFNLDTAGVEADYYYLFSQSGFSEYLTERAQVIDKLNLTALEEM